MTTRQETEELLKQNQEFYAAHFPRFVADRKRLTELLERIQQQDGPLVLETQITGASSAAWG